MKSNNSSYYLLSECWLWAQKVLDVMSIFISSSPLLYEVTMVSYFHLIKFKVVKNLAIHG